jgi:methyl-accepting chemotaxis protein
MTQQNAALVEQSAAAAESLKEQAISLASVVGIFRLGAYSAGSGAATPFARPPAPTSTRTPTAARPAVAAPYVPAAKAKPIVASQPKAASPAAPPAKGAGDDEWESF